MRETAWHARKARFVLQPGKSDSTPTATGSAPAGAREALFLDRDGVINVDRGYVAHRKDFEWRPGIFALARTATRHDIPIVIVTNQTGIGLGRYSAADFQRLNDWMCGEFADRGTPIAKVYHCAHHPDAIDPALRADHPWRKPSPGMIAAAQADLNLHLESSVLVGNKWSDIEAAHRAGVGQAVLVGEPEPPAPDPLPPAITLPDVEAVAQWYADRRGDAPPQPPHRTPLATAGRR